MYGTAEVHSSEELLTVKPKRGNWLPNIFSSKQHKSLGVGCREVAVKETGDCIARSQKTSNL